MAQLQSITAIVEAIGVGRPKASHCRGIWRSPDDSVWLKQMGKLSVQSFLGSVSLSHFKASEAMNARQKNCSENLHYVPPTPALAALSNSCSQCCHREEL